MAPSAESSADQDLVAVSRQQKMTGGSGAD
jgi:hypothetical protein